MELIRPQWPAPAAVVAVSTTRLDDVLAAPEGRYRGFNLGDHVGDDPVAVSARRQRLLQALPGLRRLAWLQQVHGIHCVRAERVERPVEADASLTTHPGVGCVVMTADCLPVLLCDRAGRQVAAAHAGWRGLVAGVLERTVAAFEAAPGELLAWLGPAIGPAHFEVGAEVRAAFLQAAPAYQSEAVAAAFTGPVNGRYRADLYALARLHLARGGVEAVYGGGFCTVAEAQRFYSYRRDGVTGRQASLIYLRAD